MRGKKLRLIVSMPGKVVMDEVVEMVILTTVEGNMGILPGHEPASVVLGNGALFIREDGKSEAVLTVMGGYATIRGAAVNVVTPIADTPERIKHAIDAILVEREHNVKYERTANLEANRAEIALKNILLRRDDTLYAFPKGRSENEGDVEDK